MRSPDQDHAAKHRALGAALNARCTHAYLVGILQNLLEYPLLCKLVEIGHPNDDTVCISTAYYVSSYLIYYLHRSFEADYFTVYATCDSNGHFVLLADGFCTFYCVTDIFGA